MKKHIIRNPKFENKSVSSSDKDVIHLYSKDEITNMIV